MKTTTKSLLVATPLLKGCTYPLTEDYNRNFARGSPTEIFFVFFGQQEWIAARQAGVWIDFSLLWFFFWILLDSFFQIQFQWSELWNIPRFKCWTILETRWPMRDSMKPDWNVIRFVWLVLKINMLDVSRIELKNPIESNQIGKQLSLIKSIKSKIIVSNPV